MKSVWLMNRVAGLAATVLLAACGTEATLTSPMTGAGPAFDVSAVDDEVIESSTLWASDEFYRDRPPVAALDGLSMSLQADVSAGPDVRIGVVEQAATIYLGATGGWTIRDRVDGTLLTSGTGGAASVVLASESETFMALQVSCVSAATTELRRAAAEAAGYATYTEPIAACTRLMIGHFPAGTSFSIRNAFRNKLIAEGHARGDSFWKTITIGGGTVYRVTHGSVAINNVNPVIVESTDGGKVTIGTSPTSFRRYRGSGFARINNVGSLAGINQLPMEQYLYGVVPRELGPIAYPEYEAQKAQAVAARTYALRALQRAETNGYHLRATTADQVYGGYGDEHPISTAAIDETRGLAARYNGLLIETLYSSASGGHTSNNEEVYNSAPVPYLRGVPDAQRGDAFAHVPSLEVFRSHANPTSLRNTAENVFESDWSTRERWTFEWTQAEISSIVSAFAGVPVGTVHALNVTERGPSGRALVIDYVTDAGTFTDRKDHIRTSLKYISASGARTSLPSTLIFIEPVKAKGEFTGGFRVYGGGFGHGVGMSQTGAVGMAQRGRTFEEILKHYYQGITLEAAY